MWPKTMRLLGMIWLWGIVQTFPCWALTAYKCMDEEHHISYQDKPCPKDMLVASMTLPSFIKNSEPVKQRIPKSPSSKAQAKVRAPSKIARSKDLSHRCLRYQHQLEQHLQELSGALRPKKREKLELDLKWLKEQVALCHTHLN